MTISSKRSCGCAASCGRSARGAGAMLRPPSSCCAKPVASESRAARLQRIRWKALWLVCLMSGVPGRAEADVERAGRPLEVGRPLLLAVDDDDNDEDDVVDGHQTERVPADDLVELVLRPR